MARKKQTPAEKLAELPGRMIELMRDEDPETTTEMLNKASGRDVDSGWMLARIQNLKLKYTALLKTLSAYLTEGERLLIEHKILYGEDGSSRILEQTDLEPIRAKINDVKQRIADLDVAKKEVLVARKLQEAAEAQSMLPTPKGRRPQP